MNYFSYEMMGKEKVKRIREEGLRNQKVHRAGANASLIRGLPKLLLILFGMLGILGLFVR